MALTTSTQSYPFGGAPAEVAQHIDFATQLAIQAVNDTNQYIETLGKLIESITELPQIKPIGDVELPNVAPFQPPQKPETPTQNEAFPSLPVFPSIGDISGITLSTKPEFNKDAPVISAPLPPSPIDATAPDSPDVTTDFQYPDAPSPTYPDVPTLEQLHLPSIPDINLEEWSLNLPDSDGISVPNVTFFWDEQNYSSDLLSEVTGVILNNLQGGTGLPPEIENAIWNRARDRENQTYIQTKNQILIENSQRGFTLPPGPLFHKLQLAAQEVQNKTGELSRDIAIKQAELELENMKLAVANALNLEKLKIDYQSQIADRLLEARKFSQQAVIDIFKSQITKLNAELDLYKAYSVGFETRLRAALTELDVYKSKLDAQKLIGDINQQSIDLYNSTLKGILTEVDIYKTNVDAITSRVNAESLKINLFKSQVEAYRSGIDAKVAEYNVYESQLKAAMFPMDVYKAEIDAFASRIQAYGIEADSEAKRVGAEVDIETLKIDKYKTQVQGVLAQIDSIIKKYQADTEVYRAAASMYQSDVSAEGERYRAESQRSKNIADIAIANSEISMKNGELSLQQALNSLKLASDLTQAQSALSSQMAAAALSTLNIGAQIGGYDNSNYNYYP